MRFECQSRENNSRWMAVMYQDQAAELRNLVQKFGVRSTSIAAPRIVVVSGGKCGVGASTVAATASAILAKSGQKVVLVDADPRNPTLEGFCSPSQAIDQSATCPATIAKGFGFLNAPWVETSHQPSVAYHLSDFLRFAKSLAKVGGRSDSIVVDTGSGESPVARALWTVCHAAIVVTDATTDSVIDTYALVKAMHTLPAAGRIFATVNRSSSQDGADVFRRLSQSCHRFLSQRIDDGGAIPNDLLLANSLKNSSRGVMEIVDSPAVCAIRQVLSKVKASWNSQASHDRLDRQNKKEVITSKMRPAHADEY